MNKIPVIGTAVMKNPHWVERLYKSIDYPVENFIIFNNNGKGEITQALENLHNIENKFIDKLNICHLPSNLGVSIAWNLIIKSYLKSPYWIIVNDDVAFTEGLLEEIATAAQSEDIGMVHPYGGDFGQGAWDLFLIKDWVIQQYGLFDENLSPAYCEDADYIMRVFNAPFKKVSKLSKIHFHGNGPANEYYLHGGQTKKTSPELNERLDKINEMNFDYLTSKWGVGWRKVNPWKYPTNRVGVPISYTTYDLKFVRSKHLGF